MQRGRMKCAPCQDGIVIANGICNTIHSLRPTDGTAALLHTAKS